MENAHRPSQREIGFFGENEAAHYLEANGFRILARNWRHRHLEVDIIAEDRDFVLFCEVKTRKDPRFGEPETFVDRSKQRHLIAAADRFIRQHGIRKEARFDILSVLQTPEGCRIRHFPAAFSPHW
ncbi:MAG: YraN family protein [Bacteroidales bacterium]|nr:YraN family protein [Bacteroidales bacterium]